MPAQWIKLTGKNGADVFVNMASVTMMRPRKRMTRLWFVGACQDHVDVAESAAEIVTRLHEQLANEADELPPVAPSELIPTRVEAPRPEPYALRAELNGSVRPQLNGAAAKLAKASAIKVSKPPVIATQDDRTPKAPISETVAEQRDQRARRRASAIMDERRQQLARKLEAMQREKGAE